MRKERLMAFTDAVLAIVMTILVLELVSYAIRFVNVDYNSGVTQGFYGIMVLLVTLANVGLSRALEKANHEEKDIKGEIADNRKRLYLDIGIKVMALILTLTVFPSAMMISVLITMVLMMIPTGRKTHEC